MEALALLEELAPSASSRPAGAYPITVRVCRRPVRGFSEDILQAGVGPQIRLGCAVPWEMIRG